MYELQKLLDRFWICRETDPETYTTLRRTLPQHRQFLNEQLGWNLVENDRIIKLEKVPPKAAPWMGIADFQDPLDYCLLCGLLLYLADLDDGEQFLLSHLTETLESLLSDVVAVDWTRFPHRKSLVRVLRHAQERQLLVVYDGVSDGFGNDRTQEVLYENTGLCREYPIHHGRSIQNCHSVADFEAASLDGAESNRRRQRVYRQLLLSPALYWTEDNHSDYDYLKNQHFRIGKYLQEAVDGQLEVHYNGAFLVLEQENRFSVTHPRESALSDVVVLLCAQLREKIAQGIWPRQGDDTVVLTCREFARELEECRRQSERGWGRTLRETAPERLLAQVLEYMEGWMLLSCQGDKICLWPAVGKWVGCYPTRFEQHSDAEGVEERDESLENA